MERAAAGGGGGAELKTLEAEQGAQALPGPQTEPDKSSRVARDLDSTTRCMTRQGEVDGKWRNKRKEELLSESETLETEQGARVRE